MDSKMLGRGDHQRMGRIIALHAGDKGHAHMGGEIGSSP
jgi:hypothetical protein